MIYVYARMIRDINEQSGAEQILLFRPRTPLSTIDVFTRHRQYYPGSGLRIRFWIWFTLTILSGTVGLIFWQSILR